MHRRFIIVFAHLGLQLSLSEHSCWPQTEVIQPPSQALHFDWMEVFGHIYVASLFYFYGTPP